MPLFSTPRPAGSFASVTVTDPTLLAALRTNPQAFYTDLHTTPVPNGAGNIAELHLDATQLGTSTGMLAHAVEVLRLNTVGGLAPTGTCDPQITSIVNVPYQADYVFING